MKIKMPKDIDVVKDDLWKITDRGTAMELKKICMVKT